MKSVKISCSKIEKRMQSYIKINIFLLISRHIEFYTLTVLFNELKVFEIKSRTNHPISYS